MSFEPKPGTYYRMPAMFGPTPGPRQWPMDEGFDPSDQTSLTANVHFLTRAEQLEPLLPPGFALWGEPVVTLNYFSMKNIPWMAGRGYNVSDFRFPAVFRGKAGLVHGSFVLIRWENLADPILSGRDELGHNKLWCEIPDLAPESGRLATRLSWLGHVFAEMAIWDMQEATLPTADPLHQGELHYKYIPRTGHPGEADAAYATLSPPLYTDKARVLRSQKGKGQFTYRPPSWRQFPFCHHVVSAVAALEVREWRGADLIETLGAVPRPGVSTRILS